jgi:nicotinamide mononucleotide adenylyltransferase
MCNIAADQTSQTLMVDPWETRHEEYQRTAVVLDHFDHELNHVRGGVATAEGNATSPHPRILLQLCPR